MTSSNIQIRDRQYYIDWLRILLILSVFLFHIGMIFNSWDWHIKNNVTCASRSVLWYIMVFMHVWRLPLLILVSGAGTYYALGRRTPGQYLSERFKRLFIPLVIGIFTLVPVQVYIEKSSRFDSLLAFYPQMFNGIYPEGNFSWHHLWFIAYLFLIALLISPLLNVLRSGPFDLFIGRLARIVSKRLGANIFLVPLMLSQAILRPFFPDNTHGLIDDWAEFASFLLFFLSGFILLSNKSMTESIRKQKLPYLLEAFLTTALLLTVPYMLSSEKASNICWDLLEPMVAWSCGMAAIGYAKQYLNFNNKFRKLANEAVYPFYLLHQPVIVIIGSYMVRMDMAAGWKAILITLASFSLTVALYWLLIRPFNLARFMFGMKWKTIEKKAPSVSWPLTPIPATTGISTENNETQQ